MTDAELTAHCERAYSEGHQDGYWEGRSDGEWKHGARGIMERLRRQGFPYLDGVACRWDAATRELVFWTLDEREMRIKGREDD